MALQPSADDIQSQTRNSPVIVGDNYELVESVGAEYAGELLGGLLAKPDSQATQFPMTSSKPELSGELQKLSHDSLSESSPTSAPS